MPSSEYVLQDKSRSLTAAFLCVFLAAFPVGQKAKAEEFKPRLETNWRYGTARSILMAEAWVPLAQESDRVLYADLRLMGDDGDNREWNAGIGYRALSPAGDAVMGVHGWLDRRRSSRGSVFYQGTAGFEYLTDDLDIRLNAYIPAPQKESYVIGGASTTPYLADTGIYYDTAGLLVEKPLHGFDVELAVPVKALQGRMESFRVAAGGFVFSGDNVETLRGVRLRAIADVTTDIQLGARFEADNLRGTQGFIEATVRFPFGSKSSVKTQGLRARMDESPERDIDVITAARVAKEPEIGVPVLNTIDNMNQRVFHVDNMAAAGGTGAVESRFNTLASASAAANRAGDIIYVHAGDGTSAGMQSGVVLSQAYQSLIGSGADFIYDAGRFTTAGHQNFSGQMILAATTAPVLTNLAANSDVVSITGENATVAGVTIENAARHGIYARAAGGADLGNLMVSRVTVSNSVQDGLRVEATGAGSRIDAVITQVQAENNQNGMRFYVQQDGDLTGAVMRSTVTGNAQHGLVLYDDSVAGGVDVDLGGGGRSAGLNGFYGNGLEDLAVELDGAALMARGNWWGQADGVYQSTPTGGLTPQIYYGAPLHDGLLLHWTFDNEWTSDTLAYDRSGNGYNGVLTGGLNRSDLVTGMHREALDFNGTSDYVRVTGINGIFTQYTVLTAVSPDTTTGGGADYVTYGYTVFSDGALQAPAETPYPMWLTLRNGEAVARTFNVSNTGAVTSGAGIGNNEWSTVGLSSTRGGQSVVYVDGAASLTYNNPGNSNTWRNGQFYVGELRAGRGIYFNGKIDDVRVYSRILSAAEVSEINRMNTSSTVDTGGFMTQAP